MNKKYIFAIATIMALSITLQAQFTGIFGHGGFGLGRTKFDHFTFTNTKASNISPTETTLGDKASSTMRFVYVGMEAYGKHMMLQMTAGYAIGSKVKQYSNFVVRDGETFTCRLAAGFYVKEMIGIMGGFHLNWNCARYTSTTADPKSALSNDQQEGTFFMPAAGGRIIGINLNVLVPLLDNKALARATLMYGGAKYKKTYGEGISSQWEFAGYYFFNDEQTFGLVAKLDIMKRRMDAHYKDEATESAGGPYIYPEFTARSTWATLGVVFPGAWLDMIFGGAEVQEQRITVE